MVMNREKWLLATQFILLHKEGKVVQGRELIAVAEDLFGPLSRRNSNFQCSFPDRHSLTQ
ncbi:hypothetical protein SAMN05444487_101272 [Marininema mesophilum]|uniref:Uncharacterized protein n=1 Tax=Marininema mesophilum TaxID=1048340 RepID=A0A1H2QP46_9BACL|nr:hypothetical protein SAMN05444487_101272 [Marininema mesophilum]